MVQGTREPGTQSLTLINRGSQARSVTASVSTANGGSWLSATPSGPVAPFSGAVITVSVNASSLAPGYYRGELLLTVAPTGENFRVPVSLAVSSNQQSIVISQNGLTFRTVAGGGGVPAQSVAVLGGGAGQLNWSAAASTLSGGSWLAAARAGDTVEVNVNPASLAAGDYYGRVQIIADGASNSPQFLSVVLQVLPPTTPASPLISPTGLIFVGRQGGADPAPQTVTIWTRSTCATPSSTSSRAHLRFRRLFSWRARSSAS